jgi:acyl-CoA synthetase (AMP-forming)/AMP-acid ligase II
VLVDDGWLDTGDLGYMLDGEVVVTGRAKDLIIVNGRNIWPQDIEWAIEARRVVKNGDSVAFLVDPLRASASSSPCWRACPGEERARPWRATWRSGARGDRRRLRRRAGAAVDGPADDRRRASSRARAPRPTTWPAFTRPRPART